MRTCRLPLLAALAALATPGEAKEAAAPLFAADSPLAIEIDGPIRALARKAETSTDPSAATLRANGETHAITVAARGNARRRKETCDFPPLRITFAAKPAEGSLFARQGSLKLVTHCRNGSTFEQQVLREYAAYRLYNVVTAASLKARLVRVRYLDGGKDAASGIGFFIEDTDDAARRLGMREIDVPDTSLAALDRTAAARAALFQYMIGNNDFDFSNGPAESDCCHNSRLIAAEKGARSGLVPVPYDFDYSGLVDAPYAAPPEQLPISSVTQRFYRGCGWQAETRQQVSVFLAARPALLAEIAAVPGLGERTRKQMTDYLAGFFTDLADPDGTVLRRCGQGQG